MRYSILLLFLVTACAKSTTLPPINGKQSFYIECGGNAKSWGTCYEKASELCHNSYDVLKKEQGNEASLIGTNSAIIGSAGQDRSLTISCRN